MKPFMPGRFVVNLKVMARLQFLPNYANKKFHYVSGPMQPLVCIVILNWNGYQDTLQCVASLERQDYANFQIMVLDNGSVDGSVERLRLLDTRVHLIEIPENLGYTGGNNLAMREALNKGAEYIWLFNNDATAERDTLSKLVAACEADPKIGLASPVVREQDDPETIQFACGLFDLSTPSYTSACEIEKAREWQIKYPGQIALVGTAMLIRRAVLETVGGLDQRIFAYWEDIDFSIRSSLAGFLNVMVFDTSIFHPSQSTGQSAASVKAHYYYFMTRNEILMWRTFCSRIKILKATLWVLRRQLQQIQLMQEHTAGVDAILAGLWDGCRGIGGGYDPDRHIPALLRQIFGRHPAFWIHLIDIKH